jgi:ribosomal protein S24E
MKLKIQKEVNNPLLKRKEIIAITEEVKQTPSRQEALSQIAALTGNTEDKVVINKIEQEFGGEKVVIYARVYETKEDREKIEPKYAIKRITPKVEEKPEEKKPEPAREEKPKEEGEKQ